MKGNGKVEASTGVTNSIAATSDSPTALWKSRLDDQEPINPQKRNELYQNFGPLLANFLQARRVDLNKLSDFIEPRLEGMCSPFSMLNMRLCAERLAKAVWHDEEILVYGDYDVDGNSALALVESFLKALGHTRIRCYQPHRFNEGYGVHAKAVERFASEGIRLMMTVDTGITATAATRRANELGMEVIITDHHLGQSETPDTPFILNPNQAGDESELGYLCGTGVAFYLCIALRSLLREQSYFKEKGLLEPDPRQWLDLFSLATIADCVPLVGDNRRLLIPGLRVLESSQRPGLSALMQKALKRKDSALSARDVAFMLAPKLNAPSRMGLQELSRELISCEDPLRSAELAGELMSLNDKRSHCQKALIEEALLQAQIYTKVQHEVLVLAGETWHEGVLGIAAAKIAENHQRPAILLRLDKNTMRLRGSMRSPVDYHNCVALLEQCSDLLLKFGGHKQAAGMELEAQNLERFRQRLSEAAMAWRLSRSDLELGQQLIHFDADIDTEISVNDCLNLEKTQPWGIGNEAPLFRVKGLSLKAMKTLKEEHAKFELRPGVDCLAFYKARGLESLRQKGIEYIDALVTPQCNRFRSRISVQLIVEHVRPSQT